MLLEQPSRSACMMQGIITDVVHTGLPARLLIRWQAKVVVQLTCGVAVCCCVCRRCSL
jgi:hypothetical protein